jgi:hypothetical protein
VEEELEPIVLRPELHDRHLPDPPGPQDRAAVERRQGRLDRLHGHHPGCERRLDLGAREGRADPARGDLDLWDLGH